MEWWPGVARPMAVFGQDSILRYLVDRRYALNNKFFNFSCVAGQGHLVFLLMAEPVLGRVCLTLCQFSDLTFIRCDITHGQDFFCIKIGFIKLYWISWPKWTAPNAENYTKIWKSVHAEQLIPLCIALYLTSHCNVPVVIVTLSMLSSCFRFYVLFRKV